MIDTEFGTNRSRLPQDELKWLTFHLEPLVGVTNAEALACYVVTAVTYQGCYVSEANQG